MSAPITSERSKGIIALLLLALIWGVLPVIPRFLSIHFALFQQVYLRTAVGFLISLVLFRSHIRIKSILAAPKKDVILIIFRATAYYLLGVIFNTRAILLTKISNVILIGNLPLLSVLGFFILGEKITLKKGAVIFLALVGALIVSANSISGFSLGLGEMLAFLSAGSISLALISRKLQSDYLNDQETATLVLLVAAFEIFIVSILLGEGLPMDNWDIPAVLFLAAAGFLLTGVSFFSNYGLARVDAVLSGNILMLETIFATLFGFLIFSEIPLPKEIVGGSCIIASVILMNRIEHKMKN